MNKSVTKSDFKDYNSKKYKAKAIGDSIIYAKESKGYLSGLYYLLT